MPSLTLPEADHYVPAPVTKENLNYANLAIIDLSKAQTAEGHTAAAVQMRQALNNQGFFYVINHGFTQAQTDRIFDIADVPFSKVGAEEKQKYVSNIEKTGTYRGYKLRRFWHINGGHDQTENYNFYHDKTQTEHPGALRPFMPEIEAFDAHNHDNIVVPILRLMALGLELPEETFVNLHDRDADGGTYLRFGKYYPRTEEEEAKAQNVWMKGHTDIGCVTVLWSQPVSGLQIMSSDGKWRWVKHIPNALVINCGEAAEFLSGGYYKATIHRVIKPPPDQSGYTRLGVFYFSVPKDEIKLVPYLSESPVIQRVGVTKSFEEGKAPTMREWRTARISTYGRTELKEGKEKGTEEQIIHGITYKVYN